MKNVLILTHSDADGICSGALVLSRFKDAKVFFTKPVSLLHDFREESREYDTIFITDIAVTMGHEEDLIKEFKKSGKEIYYFDHHPLRKEFVKRLEKSVSVLVSGEASASELVYRYFQRELPKERVWIALYGAIADYCDETNFVKERLRNWDKRAIYFEVSTLVLGIKNPEFEDYDAKRKIVSVLSSGKNPSDVPGLVESAKNAVEVEFMIYNLVKSQVKKKGFVGYVKDLPFFGFRGPTALFAATATGSLIGISAHTRKNVVDITIRSREPKLKLNRIAETSARKVGGHGGGHENAAGARIKAGKFKDFIEEVNREVEHEIEGW